VALIVQKFGGTSVADPDRMRAVADHVAFTKGHGHDVVVVVSAMGKATDNLISLAGQVSETRPGREMDMLLTTGERVSAALLTMALADRGMVVPAWELDRLAETVSTVPPRRARAEQSERPIHSAVRAAIRPPSSRRWA